jgi:hypothetical protein
MARELFDHTTLADCNGNYGDGKKVFDLESKQIKNSFLTK